MAKRRHYSRDFTTEKARGVSLTVSRIPRILMRGFRAKIKRERLSQRSLVLSWMQNWAAGRRPDEGAPE
jgi:hypothetical protein